MKMYWPAVFQDIRVLELFNCFIAAACLLLRYIVCIFKEKKVYRLFLLFALNVGEILYF